MPYVAGIDGLRGLAVLAVVLFHLDIQGFSGGFLGVSLFFTLSGYLITQILITEHNHVGKIDLRRFWSDRLRRLAPGSLVCLLFVAIASWSGLYEGKQLHGDIVASVAYFANWHFGFLKTSYADLFNSIPSPVIHFWSLAIEEQFYIVFPLIMVVLLRRRQFLIPGLVALTSASLLAVIMTDSHNLLYYGTHTRAGELLTGALLALIVPIGKQVGKRTAQTLAILGVAALLLFIFLALRSSTRDNWIYAGGLMGFSLVSVLLIIGVIVPGPVAWLMGQSPLVQLGKISYSVYLLHWPVFIALDSARVNIDKWSLSAVRLSVTLLLALLSSWLIENPIRRKKLFLRPRVALSVFAASILVVVSTTFLIPQQGQSVLAGFEIPNEIVQFEIPARVVSPIVEQRKPLKILLLGSEPAIDFDVRQAVGDEIPLEIIDGTRPNCPMRLPETGTPNCQPFASLVQTYMAESKPDLVLISVGRSERRLLLEMTGKAMSLDTPESPEAIVEIFRVSANVVADILVPLGSTPVIIVDYGARDVLAGDIDDAGMRLKNVVSLWQPRPAVLLAEIQLIDNELSGLDKRSHVMVIGDSTSYGISSAINNIAGDRYSVLWAGGRNCPLLKVSKVRWWDAATFDMGTCPSLHSEWTTAIESFHPSIVVAVDAVPEQSEQQYLGDEKWYTVTDQKFVTMHDASMKQLVDLLDFRGIKLMMFNSPNINGGALSGAQFAQSDRVASWNALMKTWFERWPQITMVDWAFIVASVERTRGSLRADGVHMRQIDLDAIVEESVVPILDDLLHPVGS